MKTQQSYKAVRGRDLIVGERRVHLLEDGANAAAVMLIHGCGRLAQEILAPFRGSQVGIIAPDRPGYGYSDPLPPRERGPLAQSVWLEKLIDALGRHRISLAAHSIGCAPVLLMAQRRPDLVRTLFLIAPFCRPTPEQNMFLLRAAVAPGIGPLFSKYVVRRFANMFGIRAMRAAHYPNPIPDHLLDFPYHHAAREQTLRTTADELLQFNSDMIRAAASPLSCPVEILYGQADAVVDPHWHLPWLMDRLPLAKVRFLNDVGHNPHHAAPSIARVLLRELCMKEGSQVFGRQSA